MDDKYDDCDKGEHDWDLDSCYVCKISMKEVLDEVKIKNTRLQAENARLREALEKIRRNLALSRNVGKDKHRAAKYAEETAAEALEGK